MVLLGSIRRSRSLESLRKDLFHTITHTTEGVYFPPGCTLLQNKETDKEVMAVLCPHEEFKASDKGIAHLTKLFVQCNKWLPVLEKRGFNIYWAVVAFTTSQMQGIDMSPEMAKALAMSLLKARQLWILRQENPDAAKSNVKTHLAAGIQRLLECFEERAKKPTGACADDKEWKLTDKQIRDACKARMGPGKRVSKDRIALSFKSPHPLVPIGQLSSIPQLENSPLNPLGMLDSSVEKITPAEAVQALLSHPIRDLLHDELPVKQQSASKRMSQSAVLGRVARDDDAQSNSSKSSSLMNRMAPSVLKTKFKSTWMKSPMYRKDMGQTSTEAARRAQTADALPTPKHAGKSNAEVIKRAQTAEASPTPKAKANANASANSSSTKKRFTSELPGHTAKKQVVAKGTARSVSMPVSHPSLLAPTQAAQASRSVSLQVKKGSKK
ncbi:hypothetical protein BBK36DRAFT_1158755 [Trichoderma citrinoviride]|uniref:Uncharacterized protein n=1 Tax=Trichoderma citrinoviride TaxID=58853 RepID=A0A2T4BBY5_9HYPO|nr:hypothetical protein BBK36DRAFT_1158755 [Trichoderma citrinoviride]PTB66798.1 hypothetical protein BBK36DRAFT_1158755 [Trichoderma citrinoviride]